MSRRNMLLNNNEVIDNNDDDNELIITDDLLFEGIFNSVENSSYYTPSLLRGGGSIDTSKTKIKKLEDGTYKVRVFITNPSTKVTKLQFKDLIHLIKLNYAKTINLTQMNGLFYGCTSLIYVNPDIFCSRTNAHSITNIFAKTQISELILSDMDFNFSANATMFSNCSKLKRVEFNNCNFTMTANASGIFANCSALEEVIFNNCTINVTFNNISTLFANCIKITKIKLPTINFDSSIVTTNTFSDCSSLKTVIIDNMNSDASYTLPDILPTVTYGVIVSNYSFGKNQISTLNKKFWDVVTINEYENPILATSISLNYFMVSGETYYDFSNLPLGVLYVKYTVLPNDRTYNAIKPLLSTTANANDFEVENGSNGNRTIYTSTPGTYDLTITSVDGNVSNTYTVTFS